MSSLSPETTQPELSGLGVTPASGVWPASGIYLASGLSVFVSGVTSVNASGAWLASGIIPNISGQAVSISGDVVSISGVYPPHGGAGGAMVQSGAYYGSGMFGPVGLLGIDLSGSLWNPIAVTTSGTNILQVGGTLSQTSGAYLASGLSFIGGVTVSGGVTISGLVGVSGGGLTISGGVTTSGGHTVSGMVGVSGNVAILSGVISVVSGSITINSGIVAVSGMFAGFSGGKFLSGQSAVSGSIPVIPMIYDYSGAQWMSLVTTTSGVSTLNTAASVTATVASGLWLASGIFFVQGSGAVIGPILVSGAPTVTVVSGNIGVSGLTSLVSGANTQTTAVIIAPKYKSATYSMSGLFSTAASSLTIIAQLLSSAVCDTVTIRNWSGNTPIFVDTGNASGTTLGAGGGFVLYGGDGLTLDYGPNMNGVVVAAQVSGTLISHFASYY